MYTLCLFVHGQKKLKGERGENKNWKTLKGERWGKIHGAEWIL